MATTWTFNCGIDETLTYKQIYLQTYLQAFIFNQLLDKIGKFDGSNTPSDSYKHIFLFHVHRVKSRGVTGAIQSAKVNSEYKGHIGVRAFWRGNAVAEMQTAVSALHDCDQCDHFYPIPGPSNDQDQELGRYREARTNLSEGTRRVRMGDNVF